MKKRIYVIVLTNTKNEKQHFEFEHKKDAFTTLTMLRDLKEIRQNYTIEFLELIEP